MNRSVLYRTYRDCNAIVSTQTALGNMQIRPIWVDFCWQFFASLLVIRHDKMFYFSQNGIFGCHNFRKGFVEDKNWDSEKFIFRWCIFWNFDHMRRWDRMVDPQDILESKDTFAFWCRDILSWSEPRGTCSRRLSKKCIIRKNITIIILREEQVKRLFQVAYFK